MLAGEEVLIIANAFISTCASLYLKAVTCMVYCMIFHVIIATVYEIWKSERGNKLELAQIEGNELELARIEGNELELARIEEHKSGSEIQEREAQYIEHITRLLERHEEERAKTENRHEQTTRETLKLVMSMMQMVMTKDEKLHSDMQEREDRNLKYFMELIKHTDEERAKADDRYLKTITETSRLHSDAILKLEEMRKEEHLKHGDTLLAMHKGSRISDSRRPKAE